MKTKLMRRGFLGLLGAALLVSGCLVSGTFIFVDDFKFTAQTGFYYYQVDITDAPDWDKHKDKIDFIDAVGVEFYITNNAQSTVIFDAWIDEFSDPAPSPDPSTVPIGATKIINGLKIEPGVTKITYTQSLGFLTGLARLKSLSKIGQFDYYGSSSENDGAIFQIDSGKVVVTVSAGT